jgi:replicative DNA helicase
MRVRELPAYLMAERTVLGALLIESDRYPEVWSQIDVEDFSLESHGRIWQRMLELREAKTAVDLVTVLEALLRHKDEFGGQPYLADLIHGLPRRPVLGDYLRIMREKRKLRSIIAACETAIEAAYKQTKPSHQIVTEMRASMKSNRVLEHQS